MTNYQFSKIQYGLPRIGGSLVHISKVPNGLSCNCICPYCKQPLIAKNDGEVREHHFAHYNSDRKCKYAYQTVLHILAKEILSELSECELLHLPSLQLSDGTNIPDITIKPQKVFLEKRLHSFVPDVIVVCDNREIVFEIFVTNKVSKEKLKKIEQSKVSAIEINLSSIKRDIKKEELKELILNGNHSSWIYNQFKAKKEDEIKKSKEMEKAQLIQKDGGEQREYRVYGGGINSRDPIRISNPPCRYDREENWAGYYKVVNSDTKPCEDCSFFEGYKYKGDYKYLICCKK